MRPRVMACAVLRHKGRDFRVAHLSIERSRCLSVATNAILETQLATTQTSGIECFSNRRAPERLPLPPSPCAAAS